jgi:hypothetical protein
LNLTFGFIVLFFLSEHRAGTHMLAAPACYRPDQAGAFTSPATANSHRLISQPCRDWPLIHAARLKIRLIPKDFNRAMCGINFASLQAELRGHEQLLIVIADRSSRNVLLFFY